MMLTMQVGTQCLHQLNASSSEWTVSLFLSDEIFARSLSPLQRISPAWQPHYPNWLELQTSSVHLMRFLVP